LSEKVLISACLLGIKCRYDGDTRGPIPLPESLCPIPVCPEQLGGLPTPRPRAYFEGGDGREVLKGRARVVNVKGEDVTWAFVRGAKEVLGLCRLLGLKKAILKDKSPSCGVKRVWIGNELSSGMGVLSALLLEEGMEVISSEDLLK
jgi:uncharacterized protein YbbK (DUF523 family)